MTPTKTVTVAAYDVRTLAEFAVSDWHRLVATALAREATVPAHDLAAHGYHLTVAALSTSRWAREILAGRWDAEMTAHVLSFARGVLEEPLPNSVTAGGPLVTEALRVKRSRADLLAAIRTLRDALAAAGDAPPAAEEVAP